MRPKWTFLTFRLDANGGHQMHHPASSSEAGPGRLVQIEAMCTEQQRLHRTGLRQQGDCSEKIKSNLRPQSNTEELVVGLEKGCSPRSHQPDRAQEELNKTAVSRLHRQIY